MKLRSLLLDVVAVVMIAALLVFLFGCSATPPALRGSTQSAPAQVEEKPQVVVDPTADPALEGIPSYAEYVLAMDAQATAQAQPTPLVLAETPGPNAYSPETPLVLAPPEE